MTEIELQYNRIAKLMEEGKCTPIGNLAKLMEESGELAAEVLKKEGKKDCNHEGSAKLTMNILEEGCDAIQNIIGIFCHYDIDFDSFVEFLKLKNKKWESQIVKRN